MFRNDLIFEPQPLGFIWFSPNSHVL